MKYIGKMVFSDLPKNTRNNEFYMWCKSWENTLFQDDSLNAFERLFRDKVDEFNATYKACRTPLDFFTYEVAGKIYVQAKVGIYHCSLLLVPILREFK